MCDALIDSDGGSIDCDGWLVGWLVGWYDGVM